jgi:hypothetical protein
LAFSDGWKVSRGVSRDRNGIVLFHTAAMEPIHFRTISQHCFVVQEMLSKRQVCLAARNSQRRMDGIMSQDAADGTRHSNDYIYVFSHVDNFIGVH